MGMAEMAMPRGMFRHSKTGMLGARKDVPTPLRAIIGLTSLKRTLHTKVVNEALPTFHAVMQEFEEKIATARRQVASGQFDPAALVIGTTFSLSNDPLIVGAGMRQLERQQRQPEVQLQQYRDQIEARLQQANLIAPTPAPVFLDELFKRWERERKPAFSSKMEFQRAKDAFKKLNGDLPIAEYTSAHARAWKDRVVDMTAPNGKPLAHATRIKWFTSVKTLFNLADGNDLLTVHPFEKIVLERPKRAKVNKRKEWDDDDLKTLFASPVFLEQTRPKGGCGEAAYWIPVLALYHGFRLGELCQLDTADVVKKDGIVCLKLAPSVEDLEDDEDGKSFKNDQSIRTVPLHAAVIALGFLDYIAGVRRAGAKKLFPKITVDGRGRWSGNFSKWFGRFRRDLGLNDRWTDFHSLRHGWKSAARGAGIPKEYHAEISGHETGDVGDTYGHVPIRSLKAEIDKIAFDVSIPKWRPA